MGSPYAVAAIWIGLAFEDHLDSSAPSQPAPEVISSTGTVPQ